MNSKTTYFIVASTIGLLLLIFMQVKWIQKSIELTEEQFDQKVSLALCMAVDNMSKTDQKKDLTMSCSIPGQDGLKCCSDNLSTFMTNDNIKEVVGEAMSFYKINLPFEMEVSEDNALMAPIEASGPSYSCSLNPLIEKKSHKLDVSFPGKRSYVIKKMGLMLASSIFILLFIIGILVYSVYSLIKQKRISERNKEFFNHMAHEFKTPLTNISLASSLLQKKSEDPLVGIISNENKHLSEQVDRVLSMASIESGQYEIRKERIQLGTLLHNLKDQLEIQINDKNAKVTIEDSSENATVFADRFHLSNAIRNVIDNALKYADVDPVIDIKLMKTGESVNIQIQDNGIGISPADKKLLFEEFYRIKKDDLTPIKGFGLGLSYVKKIMELHKGEINVFSESNQGSRFDLILPKIAS